MSLGISATGWAIGGATLGGALISSKGAKDAARTGADASAYAAELQNQQYLRSRKDLAPYREIATGMIDDPFNSDRQIKVGEGTLQQLANYGPSKLSAQDYLPETQIPQYRGSTIGNMPSVDSRLPEFDVNGDIVRWEDSSRVPEYDPDVDVYEDPGYQFRRDEMLRGIDRASAGMGKLLSGNRLEDIMSRTGEMASQEYQNAYGRNVQDYGIERERERDIYGRDVFDYQAATGEEGLQYGRDMTRYQQNLGLNQLGYGRNVDRYNRAYARDTDQYGRDLTSYNADVARESGMYNRGAQLFGLDYGQEMDYLNRLSSLSNIGQTATNVGVQAGATAAANQGNLIAQGGQSLAAGQDAQGNIYGNALGDIASMYAASQYDPYAGMANFYGAVPSPSMNANYGGGIPVNNWLARR